MFQISILLTMQAYYIVLCGLLTFANIKAFARGMYLEAVHWGKIENLWYGNCICKFIGSRMDFDFP